MIEINKDNNSIPKLNPLFMREIKRFSNFIDLEKGLSINTKVSYNHDINRFLEYIAFVEISSFKSITHKEISDFLSILTEFGLAASSRSRYLFSNKNIL